MQKGDIVTVELESNNNSSNTYQVDAVLGEKAILSHPLSPLIHLFKDVKDLNKVAAQMKDSTERSLMYAFKNKSYLDYNTVADLESLGFYFIVYRRLTSRQKSVLSNICGTISSIYFNNDINLAMRYIKENQGVLDPYNAMWFNNFKGLFEGSQPITSKKQRASIFNMAGFVLAELESQQTLK